MIFMLGTTEYLQQDKTAVQLDKAKWNKLVGSLELFAKPQENAATVMVHSVARRNILPIPRGEPNP